jgi:hypothetical protein
MIDNVDQDEWFNLYLYLGSYWVNTNRDTRLDTRYDTRHEIRTWSKRSLDQLIELKLRITELNARSLDTKVELNPDVWGPGSLLSQFQDHLLKKDQFVDDLFNHHHLPDQPGTRISCSLFVETDRPGFFKVNSFKSDNKVMKFL